jgi:hypothetical protein
MGDGAVFDGRKVVPGDFRINASNGYGVSVGGAGYSLVNQAAGGEDHYSIYQPNGTVADEYYQYRNPSAPYYTHVVTDLRGSGVGVGWIDATQMSQLGGLVRLWDLQHGVIPHALQIALSGTILNKTYVWPALSADATASVNTGFVPEGALLAIPADATMPAGMSAAGQMIWTALRDYGAYVNDRTDLPSWPGAGATVLRAEAAAETAISPARADLAKIGAQLRWVTNNTTDRGATNLGGPGNRLAPLAPGVGQG